MVFSDCSGCLRILLAQEHLQKVVEWRMCMQHFFFEQPRNRKRKAFCQNFSHFIFSNDYVHTFFDSNPPNWFHIMMKKNPRFFLFAKEKETHSKKCPDVCSILEMDFIFVIGTR